MRSSVRACAKITKVIMGDKREHFFQTVKSMNETDFENKSDKKEGKSYYKVCLLIIE